MSIFVILVLILISICWTTHIIISDFNKHMVVAGAGGLLCLGYLSLQPFAGLGWGPGVL